MTSILGYNMCAKHSELKAGYEKWCSTVSTSEKHLFFRIQFICQIQMLRMGQRPWKKNIVPRLWKRFVGVKYRLERLLRKQATSPLEFLDFVYRNLATWLTQQQVSFIYRHRAYYCYCDQAEDLFFAISVKKKPSFCDGKYFQVVLETFRLKLYGTRILEVACSEEQAGLDLMNVYWHARLLDHEYVAPIVNYFHLNDINNKRCEITVLKYFDGGDLLRFYKSKELVYNKELALRLAETVIKIVAKLHQEGIAHRDIKLTNFVAKAHVKRLWDVVLIDFERAIYVDAKRRQRQLENYGLPLYHDHESKIGTLAYLAPEILLQLEDPLQAVDSALWQAGDVWALGCVLLHLYQAFVPQELHKWFVENQRFLLRRDVDTKDCRITRWLFTHQDRYRALQSFCKNDILAHLIWRCFEYNPKRRITSADLLAAFLSGKR